MKQSFFSTPRFSVSQGGKKTEKRRKNDNIEFFMPYLVDIKINIMYKICVRI